MLKILAVGIIGVFSIILIKQTKPELSILLSISVSIVIILMLVNKVQSIAIYFKSIFKRTGVEETLLLPLFKIIAIGYLSEFGANICQDSGSSSIADKILFSAKIIILIISMPILISVLDLIVGLL